ncbi:MAG: hypothetical protein MUP98_02505 [Candidatus Aminicenantes bacterium]|nr:hypothetical protein [Candidatus Aminicenantes bacterium]
MYKSAIKFLFWTSLLMVLVISSGLSVYAQSPVTTKDLNVFSWRHLGPFTFSGRITDVAVPQGQSIVYYVATATGGLWKTEDAGTHFEPIFDKYGNMSMGHIAVAPSDHNILYLGTGEAHHARATAHGNGVWKSTDAGKTWKLAGLENSYIIPKIEVDHKNPDIVYVAAEGKLYDNEMDCLRGLFKSTDGGQTWALVLDLKDRGVGDFVIDPNNSDIIIAFAYKTYRRTWTFIDRQEGNHLYKSTDGGTTWKKLSNGIPVDIKTGRAGLAISPKNPNIVYVRLDEEVNLGLNERENAHQFREGRVFKDGYSFGKLKSYKIPAALARMAPFDPLTAESEADLVKKLNDTINDASSMENLGVDIHALIIKAKDVYKKNPDVLKSIGEIEKILKISEEEKVEGKELPKGRSQVLNRFILQLLYADVLQVMEPITKSGVIYKSEDQGESWTRMTEYKQVGGSIPLNGATSGYYGRMTIDPNDDLTLYLAEVSVKVSNDGGKTFKNTAWAGDQKSHVDTRVVWVDPANSNHILNGNDGGVTETWDGGNHWSQKDTISAQQFYDISVDNEMPYNVMGGTQDNGCWIGPSQNRNSYGVFPADWTYLPTGDGFYAVRDWWNPEYIYFESQFGGSRRMNFKTGEMIGLAYRNTAEEQAAGKPDQRYQWDSPIVLSPHNPGIVYIASQYVHMSKSHGDTGTWEAISPDLSRNDPIRLEQSKLTNLQYGTIYTFAESPVKPGVFWAGTDDGNLQLSTDGGNSWKNITDSFYNTDGTQKKDVQGVMIPYDHWVQKVTPSAFDLNTCYVAYTGYRTHNEDTTYLYVTRDLGKTWEDISQGMKNPVNDIVEDPDNPQVLYLATDYGLFVSVDQGNVWTEMSTDTPDVIIMDLDIQKRERDLAVGTYGRGIYIADIFPFKEFSTETFSKEAYLFDIQRTVKWNMFERRGPSLGEFARVDNPDIGANIYYYLKDEAESVSIVIKDMMGAVLQEVKGQKDKGIQKYFWNLRKKSAPQQGGQRSGGSTVDHGAYQVSLVVNGKDVMTKMLVIVGDPEF